MIDPKEQIDPKAQKITLKVQMEKKPKKTLLY